MHQSLDTKKDQPKPKQMVQQPQTKKDQPKPVVITPNVQKLHTKKKISLPPLHTKLSPSGPNLVTPPLVGSLPFNELYPVIAISKKKTCPGKEKKKPQKFACRCVKSRCLKLYCVCFQNGTLCGPSCTCVSCLNNKSELSGKLMKAKQEYLKRKPDAFMKKLKETKKTDCACRTNRCLKKYCNCFRCGKQCSTKCTCVDCLNTSMKKLSVHKKPSKSIKVLK